MPIVTAKLAGFCMGVKRAVDEALTASKQYGTIKTIGELVHNPQVIGKLETQGIHAVDTPRRSGRTTCDDSQSRRSAKRV